MVCKGTSACGGYLEVLAFKGHSLLSEGVQEQGVAHEGQKRNDIHI